MVYKPFSNSEDKKPFNFAWLLLERCNTLFEVANENAILDVPYTWYKSLRALKTTISFKLSDEELSKIKELLDKIRSKIVSGRSQQNDVTYFDLEKDLDEAELLIVHYMYKYDLYYPKYEAKKPFDEIAENEDI
jgi:hypothetical protein